MDGETDLIGRFADDLDGDAGGVSDALDRLSSAVVMKVVRIEFAE